MFKKQELIKRIFSVCMAISVLLTAGCLGGENHVHDFSKKTETSQYLKSSLACTETYYYSCECGIKGEETFEVETLNGHRYVAEIAEAKYLKTKANCQRGAEYYKSCQYCGKSSADATFTAEGLGDHDYTEEIPNWEYLKEEATDSAPAILYKTCVCGRVGEETFSYGDPIREYTEAEKSKWTPTNLTITLYDTENSLYGFTYQTEAMPLRPVIQVSKGNTLDGEYEEYSCSVQKERGYKKSSTVANGEIVYYYVCKAVVAMEDSSGYVYRVYDKYAGVGTEIVSFETKDLKADTFSFAHVSDSQSSSGSGLEFSRTMNALSGNCDFVIHTGDIVEKAKYVAEWKEMLHKNFSVLSKTPMMAISGNHESEYTDSDVRLISKYFNNALPSQTSVNRGEYYSFTYGNAKFIMLNTYGGGLDEEQYAWLIEELENNEAMWTIVGMHKPCYSAGHWGSVNTSQSEALRGQLAGVFAEYKVDLVLQGHDHVVSRTYPMNANGEVRTETWQTIDSVSYSINPQGVIYLENGSAGEQNRAIEDEADSAMYHYTKDAKKSSFAKISIQGNRLIVSVQYVVGSTVNSYTTWGILKEEQ